MRVEDFLLVLIEAAGKDSDVDPRRETGRAEGWKPEIEGHGSDDRESAGSPGLPLGFFAKAREQLIGCGELPIRGGGADCISKRRPGGGFIGLREITREGEQPYGPFVAPRAIR